VCKTFNNGPRNKVAALVKLSTPKTERVIGDKSRLRSLDELAAEDHPENGPSTKLGVSTQSASQ
jgi:hypothetical protein